MSTEHHLDEALALCEESEANRERLYRDVRSGQMLTSEQLDADHAVVAARALVEWLSWSTVGCVGAHEGVAASGVRSVRPEGR